MGSRTHGQSDDRRRSWHWTTAPSLAISTGRTALQAPTGSSGVRPALRHRRFALSRLRDALASFFTRPASVDYLARYVIRECSRGRALGEVLDDPYVVNRSTREERARLLERPEVIEAVGRHLIAEMRSGQITQPL